MDGDQKIKSMTTRVLVEIEVIDGCFGSHFLFMRLCLVVHSLGDRHNSSLEITLESNNPFADMALTATCVLTRHYQAHNCKRFIKIYNSFFK